MEAGSPFSEKLRKILQTLMEVGIGEYLKRFKVNRIKYVHDIKKNNKFIYTGQLYDIGEGTLDIKKILAMVLIVGYGMSCITFVCEYIAFICKCFKERCVSLINAIIHY